jgi:hypothetical protein
MTFEHGILASKGEGGGGVRSASSRERGCSTRWASPALFAAALSGVLSAPLPARADATAQAKQLFDRGLVDFEAGRLESACPAIEQSYRLDPHPGTLFTLAECENKRGHLATALRRYDEYLSAYGALSPEKMAKQGDREKIAKEQKAALSARVSELTLALPPNAPPGTTVTRDGQPVDRLELGTPVRVDPGDHVVVTQAPGGPPTTVRITLSLGERRGIALLVAPPAATVAPVPADPEPRDQRKPEGPSRWRLYTGSTLVGLSAVSLVTGIVATTQVISAINTVNAKRLTISEPNSFDWCSPANAAPNGLSSACANGSTFQIVEIVAYPLAAASLGVGIYLLVTHSRQPVKPAAARLVVVPSAGPRYTGLEASLRF